MMDAIDPGVAAALVLAIACAGLLAGFMGGLFGVGGGIVTAPALYTAFTAFSFDPDVSLKVAVGTSLAVIVITSARSVLAHRRSGRVDFAVLRGWAPWIALGAAAGGGAARWIPAEALGALFVIGALLIGLRRLRGAPKGGKAARIDPMKLSVRGPCGVIAGFFSSLMGIGGGAVGVAAMTMVGRSMHEAVATSAGFGAAVATPGALAFVLSGWGVVAAPPGSVGYVNVPAFLIMGLCAGLIAPVGARLAHRLSPELLSRAFGAYALFAALFMAQELLAA